VLSASPHTGKAEEIALTLRDCFLEHRANERSNFHSW
jgi:hypothetical protein